MEENGISSLNTIIDAIEFALFVGSLPGWRKRFGSNLAAQVFQNLFFHMRWSKRRSGEEGI